MPIACTVTAGYGYTKTATVDYEDLNKLGNPSVQLPDGQAADFASVLISMGTAKLPSLKGRSALLSGLFFEDLEVGVTVNASEVVRFTSEGVELVDGLKFAGDLVATAGTEAQPSISFKGATDTGFWLQGGAISMSVDGKQVVAISDTTTSILTAAFNANAGTFSGNLAVDGTLTVKGSISGTIDKIAAGTVSAPGLGFTDDKTTGLYRPALTSSTNRMANTCGGVVTMIHNADTGVNPYTYFGNTATDTDWPTLGLAQVIIDAPGGRAPVNFTGDSEYSSSGSGAANITNLPTGATVIPRWLRGRLNNNKVLIPCFPFEW